MIDCCELALANSRLALYIALGAFGTIALLLLMFFGYNLTLGTRTAKLEKKNGKEQKQIDELRKEIQELKKTKNA
jgi:cell division protein FtsL